MKHRFLGSCLLIFAVHSFGQTIDNRSKIIPFLPRESQSNIVVFVNALNTGNPQITPVQYTNVIWNTNLFSDSERKLLEEIPRKYRHVTTNAGPAGTRFVAWTNSSLVSTSTFHYTNSESSEEIRFARMISAKFRTNAGNGYNVDLSVPGNSILNFSEVKSNVVDGLYVSFYKEHCASWMRFVNGKAVGKWIMWGEGNTLLIEAEFKQPYDFFKYMQKLP